MPSRDALVVRCPNCGVKNRIPAGRLKDHPKCGRCGVPIRTADLYSSRPVKVTDADFQTAVLASPLPVLLDCWAPWCGPCRMVGPVMDELAREWQGRVKVAKLNVDENPQTASRFGIQSIPTMLVFSRGKMVHRMVGALPKHEIVKNMTPFLS